jgi:hypothetical protein
MIGFSLFVNLPAASRSNYYDNQDEDRNEREARLMRIFGDGKGSPLQPARCALRGDHPYVGIVVSGGNQVVGNSYFFVDAQIFGVSADKTFVEDAARKQLEVLIFNGAKQASSNLCGSGDFVQRDASHLSLSPQSVAEGTHPLSLDSKDFRKSVYL